jgi:predicted GTPase
MHKPSHRFYTQDNIYVAAPTIRYNNIIIIVNVCSHSTPPLPYRAGRDFHNFQTVYRDDSNVEVVGFTAAQIPGISDRPYPAYLAGSLYPDGLPIFNEDELEKIIQEHKVTTCILSYSDLSYNKVMELADRCLSSGAAFSLLPPRKSMIKATSKPVIAVCAVRTGCGKSQVSCYIDKYLKRQYGLKSVLIRHPMPYGDLKEQAVQRFATYEDLEKHKVTIEEREEYEQHIKRGTVVYAGVEYGWILNQAEQEDVDVVLFDGGNNDVPFYAPDLWFCIADPHRAGHESMYYPGELNFKMADAIIINKANTADEENIAAIKKSSLRLNPSATVYVTDSVLTVDKPELVRGKRVLLIEDGPTLTHGEMQQGAAYWAAQKYGAGEIVDPRPYLKGSLMDTYKKYPHLGKLIPAMGYWPQQVKDLEESIAAVLPYADTVVIGTPMNLTKLIKIDKPTVVVSYAVEDREPPFLNEAIDAFVQKFVKKEGNGK